MIAAVQGVFQEAGGRMIEVTNRDYQLRGVDQHRRPRQAGVRWSSAARPDGTPVHLKDVGYLQVGYDQRRSTVDLDGTGEVVGGIAIMEQDQNVLAVTRALEQKLQQLAAALPAGRRDRHDLRSLGAGSGRRCSSSSRRSASSWSSLIVVTLLFLRNIRTAVGPIAILLFSMLFTALPLVGFSQTINLFSLAGLAIAIGEIADATIVIVENCTAELSLRGAGRAATSGRRS